MRVGCVDIDFNRWDTAAEVFELVPAKEVKANSDTTFSNGLLFMDMGVLADQKNLHSLVLCGHYILSRGHYKSKGPKGADAEKERIPYYRLYLIIYIYIYIYWRVSKFNWHLFHRYVIRTQNNLNAFPAEVYDLPKQVSWFLELTSSDKVWCIDTLYHCHNSKFHWHWVILSVRIPTICGSIKFQEIEETHRQSSFLMIFFHIRC